MADEEVGPMVSIINEIVHARSGLDMALAVGNLYLQWRDDGLRVSVRRLSAHPAAVLRRSSLNDYVNVALQARALDPGLVQRLGLSLHVALIPADPRRKRELARRAVAEGWSVADMRAAVASRDRPSGHRRRVRAVADDVVRTAEALDETARHSLDQLTEEEREELARRVEEGAREIAERLRRLGGD